MKKRNGSRKEAFGEKGKSISATAVRSKQKPILSERPPKSGLFLVFRN